MGVSINKQGIVSATGEQIGINLFSNSDFSDTYEETRWNTTKNGTTLATGWSGYNSGVTNASTVYHAHLKNFQNEWVYEYIKTANESWLAIWQSDLNTVIQPNTTYTWSIDEYRVSGANNYFTAGLYYKRTSDDTSGFYSGNTHGNGEDAFNKWVRRYYTFTTGDVYTAENVRFYIYGYNGGNGTLYIRRPKLEVGSAPTPWTMTVAEGNEDTPHGFIESVSNQPTKIYENYVEANNFIEL